MFFKYFRCPLAYPSRTFNWGAGGNCENAALKSEYVKNGKLYKSLLCIVIAVTFDAAPFTELTLKVFEENNLDLSKLLSQYYDEVPVMSGIKEGLEALIQQMLQSISHMPISAVMASICLL